jgi:hypothetical protein
MIRILLVLSLAAAAVPAVAKPCKSTDLQGRSAVPQSGCERQEKLMPYEPGAQGAGRQPGFIDLGGGTEIRVGGRVQMDYDTRRR